MNLDNKIYIIKPNKNISKRLQDMIKSATNGSDYEIIEEFSKDLDLTFKRIIFALELDDVLCDLDMLIFFKKLLAQSNAPLNGSVGSLIISSFSELGTKNAAQDIIFLANTMGCTFIGHPLIEATASLKNLLKWQKVLNLSLYEVLLNRCENLGKRLLDFKPTSFKNPKITVLYSTPSKQSNTLALWNMVKCNLPSNLSIKEVMIENGEVLDCKGCPYKLCVHYGKQNSCFYGGTMVHDIIPAIETSDIIVWLCPNYNDAIAANLTAVINRLTVLYNKMSFYDKVMFGIVVSGNSGSDCVGKQLIGALNLNKGFQLSPYSILSATANDPKSIHEYENIHILAKSFAKNIMSIINN